jgi:hypothetical protein
MPSPAAASPPEQNQPTVIRARQSGRSNLSIWFVPLGILTLATLVLFVPTYFIDYRLAAVKTGWFKALFTYDIDTVQNALANLAQVVAAVLSIAITVISIVVQLAATRYTPRITDLFFRERTNVLVMGFFVVACTYGVWVAMSVQKNFIPHVSIAVVMLLMTLSLLMLLPYFAFVFEFLAPANIVARMQQQAVEAAVESGHSRDFEKLSRGQALLIDTVEQIGDIGQNALAQKDKAILVSTIKALKDLAVLYLEGKKNLLPAWFSITPTLRLNPDFVSLSQVSVETLEKQRCWVEMKVLRQYEQVFTEALNRSRDITHLIAIETRNIAEMALQVKESTALELTIKYFNTYFRAVVNNNDVRTGYNLLNQYRLLAEQGLRAGIYDRVADIAFYFKYYAQLCFSKGLPFITETAAFDLVYLIEMAFEIKAPNEDALLGILLELDRRSTSEAQERSLRGVRIAQSKLATYYLVHGAKDKARRICDDMKDEPAHFLRAIRDELANTDTADFWEVVDRGENFTYLDPVRRAKVGEFFAQFPQLAGEVPAAKMAG